DLDRSRLGFAQEHFTSGDAQRTQRIQRLVDGDLVGDAFAHASGLPLGLAGGTGERVAREPSCRPRRRHAVVTAAKWTGRRARSPDPGTGPASPGPASPRTAPYEIT